MMSRAMVVQDAAAFQSELDVVLAAAPPRLLRTTGMIAGGFLICLVAVAGFVRTDVVVVGSGALQADAAMVVLQPMERGVVRELRVRPGERVTRGQVLAVLDATFTQADLDTLRRQARVGAALIGRLEAELSPSPPANLPDGLGEAGLQARLYAQRAQEYRERLADYDATMAREMAARFTAAQSVLRLQRQLAIAAQVVGLREALLRTQSGSRLQFLQAEDSRLQAARALDQAQGDVEAHLHALDAARAERQGYVAQWHREVLDALVAARAEQARVGDGLTKAGRLHELVELRAPQDGIVLEVAARAAGSVASGGEKLVTILPAGAPMVAEVAVASADVGGIAEGDLADLKVDAFAYQQHGVLHGAVRSIGEESFHPQPGMAMHLVRIPIAGSSLHGMAKGAALIPGMTVSAEVHAGTRNLLGYFLTPVTRGLGESFREP